MKLANTIWLLASFVISFASNFALKPRVDETAYAAGSTLASGEAQLSGTSHAFKLLDLRVVLTEAKSPIGHAVPVQILVMRSALGDGQGEPDLELFVDVAPKDGSALPRGIDALRRRPLAVLPAAPGSSLVSRVRLPGAEGPAEVSRGQLTLTDSIEVAPQTYRVRGELDLELREGEHTQALMARVVAKLGLQ